MIWSEGHHKRNTTELVTCGFTGFVCLCSGDGLNALYLEFEKGETVFTSLTTPCLEDVKGS